MNDLLRREVFSRHRPSSLTRSKTAILSNTAGLGFRGKVSGKFTWYLSNKSLIAADTTPENGHAFTQLSATNSVTSSLNFGDGAFLPNNVDGFIGFRFDNGANATDKHFGYVRAVGNADGTQLSLTTYAYEDQINTAIHVGSVPEPAVPLSLGMLALGAAGVTLYRRRRRDEKSAETGPLLSRFEIGP